MKNNVKTTTNDYQFSVAVWNIIKLQFRTMFCDYKNVLMIIFIPMLLLFGIGCLIPAHDIFVSAFGMSEILIISITFASLAYSLTETTIYKNIKLARGNDSIIYFGTAITCFVVALMVMGIQFAVLMPLESIHFIFMDNFSIAALAPQGSMDIIWPTTKWGVIFYYFVMTYLLTFAILMLTKRFIKDVKLFYMFVLTYILIDLFWGGVLSSPFKNWDVTNNTWTPDVIAGTQKNFTFFTWFSLIFPQYYLNQFAFYVFRASSQFSVAPFDLITNTTTVHYAIGDYNSLYYFNFFSLTDNFWWQLNLIMPPLFIALNCILFWVHVKVTSRKIF